MKSDNDVRESLYRRRQSLSSEEWKQRDRPIQIECGHNGYVLAERVELALRNWLSAIVPMLKQCHFDWLVRCVTVHVIDGVISKCNRCIRNGCILMFVPGLLLRYRKGQVC